MFAIKLKEMQEAKHIMYFAKMYFEIHACGDEICDKSLFVIITFSFVLY